MAMFDMIRGNAPGMIGGSNRRDGFQPPQGSWADMLTNRQNPWGSDWGQGQMPMDADVNNFTPDAQPMNFGRLPRQNDPNAQPMNFGRPVGAIPGFGNQGRGDFGRSGGMSGLGGGMTGGMGMFNPWDTTQQSMRRGVQFPEWYTDAMRNMGPQPNRMFRPF